MPHQIDGQTMDPRTAKMLEERRAAAASASPPPRGLARAAIWARANRGAAGVAGAAALVALFVLYYFAVAMPAQQREQAELKAIESERVRSETLTRQADMDACLTKARTDADASWNSQCKTRGRRAGCALPSRLADKIESAEREARNACLLSAPPTTR